MAAVTTTGRRALVSTVITLELLLQFSVLGPSPGGGESWFLESSVHTQGHTPPAPLQASGPSASPSGLVHLLSSAFSVRVLAHSKPSSPLLSYKTQNRARRTVLAKDFPLPNSRKFLRVPHAAEQTFFYTTTRGDSGKTALGEGLGEEIQPLRASGGTQGPTVISITIPGTPSFSLGPSGPVGDYWRSAFVHSSAKSL